MLGLTRNTDFWDFSVLEIPALFLPDFTESAIRVSKDFNSTYHSLIRMLLSIHT